MEKLNKKKIKHCIALNEAISVKELYRRYYESSDPTTPENLIDFFNNQIIPSKYFEVIEPTRQFPYWRVRRKTIIDNIIYF